MAHQWQMRNARCTAQPGNANGPDFRSCPAVLRAVRIQVGMRLSRQPSKSPLRRLSSDVLLVQGERPQLHAHHLHGRGAARRSARILLIVSVSL